MADLIDRAALEKALEQINICIAVDKTKMFRLIKNAPTVDAVKVVRCKDCKHSHNYPWGSYSCSFHEYEGEPHVEPNDFCSYGERRDNNE